MDTFDDYFEPIIAVMIFLNEERRKANVIKRAQEETLQTLRNTIDEQRERLFEQQKTIERQRLEIQQLSFQRDVKGEQ
jgi:hypothetical protein